jgi:hypothetical protein
MTICADHVGQWWVSTLAPGPQVIMGPFTDKNDAQLALEYVWHGVRELEDYANTGE